MMRLQEMNGRRAISRISLTGFITSLLIHALSSTHPSHSWLLDLFTISIDGRKKFPILPDAIHFVIAVTSPVAAGTIKGHVRDVGA